MATTRSRVRLIALIAIAIATIAIVSYFLTTRDYGTLNINVSKMDGTPISSVVLQVTKTGEKQGSSPDYTVTTNREGSASIQVPPGEYIVAFDHAQSPHEYAYPDPFPASIETQRTTSKSIQLFSTGQSEKKATLQVRVLLHNNAPARDVEVGLWSLAALDKPLIPFTKTDAFGFVVFTVSPGDYAIGFNIDTFPHDYIFQEKMTISLKEGQNEKVVQLVYMP